MSEGGDYKMADYTMANLAERAELALDFHRDYVDKSLAAYKERSLRRLDLGIPPLAVLGMGRAGKDTAASYLGAYTQLHYAGSSSNRLCRFVAHAAGVAEDQAFAERHEHRAFWKALGHEVRRRDNTLLCRLTLAHGDFALGLRGQEEVHACLRDGVVVAALWIDNPRVPADPTVEFSAADCDLSIPNHGSFRELYRKLDCLARLLRLPLRQKLE